MTRFLTILICAAVALACAPRTLHAQTHVTLRDRADISGRQLRGEDASRPAADILTLGDIADLDGPEAKLLSRMVIVPNVRKAASRDGLLKLSLSEVRAALDAAGANWGRVSLSGSTCSVRTAVIAPPEPKPAPAPRSPKALPEPVDETGPATVRTLVGVRLAEHYGVDTASLRLSFDESDEGLLSMPAPDSPGRRIEVQPAAGPGSQRMPVNIAIYDGDRIALSRIVNVNAQLLKTVVTAANIIDRGQTISDDLISVQKQWLPPGGKALATPEQIIGSIASQRIASGQVINQSDVTTPIIVKRGEIVYVHAVNGAFVVKVKARAMGSARDGEFVQLKLDGSDEVFTARMSGRGRAVMLVADDNDQKPASATAAPGAQPTLGTQIGEDGADTTSPVGTRVFAPPAKPAKPTTTGASR